MVEVIPRIFPEPLYLLKDGTNEVLVNNCHLLKQHQINGLRFLFTQFKKKKQGVIVNFPSNCGKTVIVVLFLQAIRELFKKPVLILCKHEDEMNVWKEYFLKWTDFNEDDIAVNSAKVHKSKRIFIKQSNDLLSYQHHSWSVFIVKDDLMNKDIAQISDADYKIWITSTDVKKDLTLLAYIYKWLYPKLVLNVKDFIPSSKKHSDILLKSIYLDSFLEDFVIREDYIKQFDTAKKSTISNSITDQNHENKVKKSRKNKDDTGTKIKRSRRIIKDDDPPNETEVSINEVQDDRHNNEANKNNLNNSESIIHNSSEFHKYIDEKTLSATNNVETKMEVDSTEQMNFNDAMNEIVKNENIQTENSTESFDSKEWNKNETGLLDNEFMKLDENNETKQDVLDDSVHIDQQNLDREEKCTDVVEIKDMTMDLGETKESVKSHNNIDSKLSELEEKTMKKFKGSFLDSIF